jgi:hypothetical protein
VDLQGDILSQILRRRIVFGKTKSHSPETKIEIPVKLIILHTSSSSLHLNSPLSQDLKTFILGANNLKPPIHIRCDQSLVQEAY